MKKITFIIVLTMFLQPFSFSQSCLPNGITFSEQNEINDFQTNYPGCTEIEGNVEISGGDITNLNGLSPIISFGGDLWIHNNDLLQNLTGLDNLVSIYGTLIISQNNVLQNLVGLDNLVSIGQSLYVGGYEYGGSGNLSNLNGLNNLTTIGRDFIVQLNSGLVDFQGLENLLSISGNFYVEECSSLLNFSGLNSLTTIGESFYLEENFSLTSLSGLNNLNNIGTDLTISATSYLENINPLTNLTTIGGELELSYNYILSDLIGLKNINSNSISNLYITNNDSLTFCHVKSICDYIANPNGIVEIYDNKIGCDSEQEVEEACESASVFDNTYTKFVSIFPNPAESIIIISTNFIVNEVNIYNQMGQSMLNQNQMVNTIDISALTKGIYIIEFTTKDHKIRKKLIIK